MHLLEPTHNARFIALMDRFMPQWQERRQLLNRLPASMRTGNTDLLHEEHTMPHKHPRQIRIIHSLLKRCVCPSSFSSRRLFLRLCHSPMTSSALFQIVEILFTACIAHARTASGWCACFASIPAAISARTGMQVPMRMPSCTWLRSFSRIPRQRFT